MVGGYAHLGGAKRVKESVWSSWARRRDEGLQRTLLGILCKWLEAQDMGEKDLAEIPETQPLRLRLLRRLRECAGDPDREFLRYAEEGLLVGIRYPLPRTPHVFEEQLHWPLDNQPWEPGLRWVPNYGSVEEHVEFARAKFEEDITEGLMLKMSLCDFKAKYGEHRAIAALAVIVEDELSGKKRMIHDAFHGVRVNHRIRCRDNIRAPAAREKKQLLREMMEAREVAFSVVGDHRRFKHREEEHGYLGCQIENVEEIEGDADSQTVYVNKVGTFGVSCASYWWTRISAAGIRATHHLLTRVHAGPATLRRRFGVTWSWSLGKKGDTSELLLHVAVRFSLQMG